MRSPSSEVWAGRRQTDSASWLRTASRVSSGRVSAASVATTTSVVCSPTCRSAASGAGIAGPPVSGVPARSNPSPTPFTTASAATVAPCTSTAADPRPPGCVSSRQRATSAPVPAPTRPTGTGSVLAAAYTLAPLSRSGRIGSPPSVRSKMTAAGTIGTGPALVATPRPSASSAATTPSAAASPNALPPLSTRAWACSTDMPGASSAVSRVPGAAPRTSPATTLGSGRTTTVQPVRASASDQCPTARPATSVRVPRSSTRIAGTSGSSFTDSPFGSRSRHGRHRAGSGAILPGRGPTWQPTGTPSRARDPGRGEDPTRHATGRTLQAAVAPSLRPGTGSSGGRAIGSQMGSWSTSGSRIRLASFSSAQNGRSRTMDSSIGTTRKGSTR